jgi:uncharacterized protein
MTAMSRRTFVTSTIAAAGAGLLAPLADRVSSVAAAPALAKRKLGRTGVELTLVGFGALRFSPPEIGDEEAAEFLRHFIDRGSNFVETSANYGANGKSEIRVGLAMKTHRAKVFLETKVDARDYDGAMREMERSLERMHTDRLDLVLHHDLSNAGQIDQITADNGAQKAIRKMIDQKAVRFHGFSSHSPALTLEAIKRLDPDVIQVIVNATKVPDMEREVLPLAKAKNIGVIGFKSCGAGFFFKNWVSKKPTRYAEGPPPPGVLDLPNLPTPSDYLRYTLSTPVSTVAVGIDAMRTADLVIEAALAFKPLSAAEMASMSDRAQVFRTTGYWVPRARPTPGE